MLRDIVRAIEKEAFPVGQETIPCIGALDRVAARTLKSGRGLPAFDVSALDGFACRGSGNTFTVKAWLGPGEKSALRLKAGEAVFVPTGAGIPAHTRFVPVEHVQEEGATILVEPQSDTKLHSKADRGGDEKPTQAYVEVRRGARRGDNEGMRMKATWYDMRRVWKKGYWIRKGDRVAIGGKSITPRAMELLALAGLETIPVFRKPRVSILSTGNELKKGIVVNSNQYLLTGLVERDGGVVAHMAIAGDDEAEIGEALSSMADADLLLVTGGTAKGKKDITRSSFQACGATFLLEALPVVPGKTMTFGKLDQTPFFILPGNPRALRTLYEVFIRPCLSKLAGSINEVRMGKVRVPEEIEKEAHTIHLIPVTLSAGTDPRVRTLYVDEPDGIVILERGTKRVRAGEEAKIQWADA